MTGQGSQPHYTFDLVSTASVANGYSFKMKIFHPGNGAGISWYAPTLTVTITCGPTYTLTVATAQNTVQYVNQAYASNTNYGFLPPVYTTGTTCALLSMQMAGTNGASAPVSVSGLNNP